MARSLSTRRTLAVALFGAAQWIAAGAALSHGDLHERIEAATRRIEAAPNDPALRLRRAELHRRHGEWAPALADLDRAEALAPGRPEVALERAQLHLDAKRPALALAIIDPLVAAAPDGTAARALRAQIREALADWRGAAADHAQVIARTAEPEVDQFAALARVYSNAGDLDRAIGAIDAGIARLGPLVSLQAEALRLERTGARWEAALARVDRLLASAPRKEGWIVERAEILREAGRADAARDELLRFDAAIAALAPHLQRTQAVQGLVARRERLGSAL